MEYEFSIGGEKRKVRIEGKPPRLRALIDDAEHEVDWAEVPGGVISLIVDGTCRTARVARRDAGLVVWVGGRRFELDVGAAADETVSAAGAGAASGSIKAPMPGSVVKVLVAEGDEIQSGQSLVIVEAMKMENDVRSPVDGVIKAVNVSAGDSVGTTEAMIEIEPAGSEG